MGTIKIQFFLTLLCFSILSCGSFDKGFTNHNGQYVPKNPNFKLKDKPNNNIPSNLDTSNVYRLSERYEGGKLIYPKKNLTKEEYYSFLRELQMGNQYIKFYPNGRCLSFTVKVKDSLMSDTNILTKADLNPNNPNCSKEYYHSKDGKEVYKESFVYGEGYGMYSMTSFVLTKKGDTLTFDNYKGSKSIYVKEILPIDWQKYKADW